MDNGDGGEFFLDQSDSTSHVPSPLPGGADNAWGKGASAPSFVDHPWRGDANRHHRCGDAASRSWRSSSLSANNSALRRAALAVKLAAGNRERRMQQMIMLSGPAQRFRPITLREHVRTLHAEGLTCGERGSSRESRRRPQRSDVHARSFRTFRYL